MNECEYWFKHFGMQWRRGVTLFWAAWVTLVTLGRK